MLLTIAAALAWLSGTPRLGIVPALNSLFGTAPLTGGQLATVLPFPFIVWGRTSSAVCSCAATQPTTAW